MHLTKNENGSLLIIQKILNVKQKMKGYENCKDDCDLANKDR